MRYLLIAILFASCSVPVDVDHEGDVKQNKVETTKTKHEKIEVNWDRIGYADPCFWGDPCHGRAESSDSVNLR